MRKVIKILASVFSGIIIGVLALVLLAALLLNVEGIQNFVVTKAGAIISEKIGTTVSIGRINIRGFSRVAARDVYVEDYHGDTLIYAGKLTARLDKGLLFKNEIVIGEVSLDSAKIYLTTYENGGMNISEIIARISDPEKESSGSKLFFNDIFISNSVFRLKNLQPDDKEYSGKGVNFSDMELRNLNLGSKNLEIGDVIKMDLYALSFIEKSGFRLDILETRRFSISDGTLDFEELRIKTPGTDLDMPAFSMKGSSWEDFSDVLNRMRFTARISDSRLNSTTLGYFIPSLPSSIDGIQLTGLSLYFDGTLNNFGGSISSLRYGETTLAANYNIKNILKDINSAEVDVELAGLSTSSSGIAGLIEKFSGEQPDSSLVSLLANAGEIELRVEAKGKMSDLKAAGSLSTAAGTAVFSGDMAMTDERGLAVRAEFSAHEFDTGKLLGNEMFGPTSVKLRADGVIKDKIANARVNLGVEKVYVNGYTYHDVSFNGRLRDRLISGTLTSNDPALDLEMRGRADLRPETPAYDLTVDLTKADLAAMKLNKTDSVSVVSGKITAQGSGATLDDLNGLIAFEELRYDNGRDSLSVDRMELTGDNSRTNKKLALKSEFITAEFASTMSYRDVFYYLNKIVSDYAPSLMASRPAGEGELPKAPDYSDNDFSTLKVDILNTDPVTRIFVPGLSIAPGSGVNVRFNPFTEKFNMKAESEYVEYDKYFFTKLAFTGSNENAADSLGLHFATDEIYIPGIVIPTISLNANVKDDKIDLRSYLSNEKTQVNAMLDLSAALARDENNDLTVSGAVNPSRLVTDGKLWDVSSSEIFYSKERISISDFGIRNNGQGLSIHGVLADERTDTLHVHLDEVDLSVLTGLLASQGYVPHGRLSGFADLISAMKDPLIVADIAMEDMGVNEYTAAPMRFTSRWDFGTERARLILTNTRTEEQVIRGYYRPASGAYMADINITNLPLALATPLIGGSVTDVGGMAAVKLDVRSGQDKKPVINGTIGIGELRTTVDFTKVTYTVPEVLLSVDNNIITLPRTTLTDPEGGSAELEASMDITNFSSISYDVKLQPKRLLAVNTSITDSESFYGKIYTSGNIQLHGDKMGIDVNAVISTDDNSTANVPVSGNANVATADFITYEHKTEPVSVADNLERKKLQYRMLREQAANQNRADFNITAALNITPGTTLKLVIDPSRNDALEVRGNASLNASINPNTGDMNVFGTYEITEGEYLFNFQNIISNKLFVIRPGSTIQLVGDPMESLLNIEAVYSLRASLAPLVSSGILDNQQYGRGRVPVDCIIKIGGRLSGPEFAFNVVAQTSDANLQATLNSMLAAQDMMATQFVWLVALGNFTTENMSSTGVSGAAIGIDFVTNQLNNLFSTISDDATINIQYRQKDEYNSDEIDFGFTKEFFDGRMILEYEGNYDTGYSTYKETPLSNNLSLTALLNTSGNVRMKLFTRSVDRFDDNLVVQETGVGIYYREDFNRFSEVIEKMKTRIANMKRRREEKKKEEEAAAAAQEIAGETEPEADELESSDEESGGTEKP